MSDIKKGTLGEILSASQIITPDDISKALEEQKRAGCRFGEALVNLGIVAQEDIDWALSNQLDIPYIRLKQDMIDPAAIALIPAAMARTYNCIPLIRAGGELNIALADPLNRPAIEAIERESGCSVNISVALLREIREMIDVFYGIDLQDVMGFESPLFSVDALDAINADLSGGILLDYLLDHVLKNQMSSLSFHPLGDVVLIRGKRGGGAVTIGTLAPNHYPELSLRMRRNTVGLQPGASAGNGTLTFTDRSAETRFQAAFLSGEGGDCITLQQLADIPLPGRFADLHLPSEQASAFSALAGATKGVTLFASHDARERELMMDLMLEEMETDSRNVVILGGGAGQGSKRFPRVPLPEGAMDRARLLVAALDHEPDVLVVDDVSEAVVFGAACRAAMRGTLVLAGFDAQGTGTVLRQLLHFQRRSLFMSVCINGIVSVTGIRLLCPSCRCDYLPQREELAAMNLVSRPPAFSTSRGCDACGYRGFSERRFLVEALPFDETFLRMFETAVDTAEMERFLRESGHRGIEAQAQELLRRGVVSPEEYITSIIL